jgi:hypothetical protein
MSCCLLVCVSCSNPAFEPPASEDDLQIAYEAALWHLLGFFFLEYDDLDRGAFPEVRTASDPCRLTCALADVAHCCKKMGCFLCLMWWQTAATHGCGRVMVVAPM